MEDSLLHERSAREQAEDRALQLEYANLAGRNGNAKGSDLEGTIDIMLDQDMEVDNGDRDDISVAGSDVTICDLQLDNDENPQAQLANGAAGESSPTAAHAAEAAAAQWQKKIEEMMAELKAAKEEIESYKKRVRTAEEEGEQSRRTLSEMVAKIRADEERRKKERKERSVQTEKKPEGVVIQAPTMVSCGVQAGVVVLESDGCGGVVMAEGAFVGNGNGNGVVKMANGTMGVKVKSREQSPHRPQTTELIRLNGGRGLVKESMPYVSIVGVVIIGVGIMAILNTWQKVER